MAKTSEQHPGISRAAKRLILIVEDDTDIGPVFLQAITALDRYQAVLVSEGIQALKFDKQQVQDFTNTLRKDEGELAKLQAELPAFQANVERNQKLVQEAKQRLAAAKTTFNQDEAQLYKDVQAQH